MGITDILMIPVNIAEEAFEKGYLWFVIGGLVILIIYIVRK
jgi:hypothetical protein